MEQALYWLARSLIGLLQVLPLLWVVRLGRLAGGLFYYLDARHRRVARKNLAASFPEKSMVEVRTLAKENFKRIGENFASAVKTASMTDEELKPHLAFANLTIIQPLANANGSLSKLFAVGHFGNFELYARTAAYFPGFHFATTYRALRQPALNRLMQDLRARSGCIYFERRTQGHEMRQALQEKDLMLGFLCDQHGGDHGLRMPFLGRECSVNPAPAIFALRYKLPLFTSFCFRIAPGRWLVEFGLEIPTHIDGVPRSPEAIMTDVNRDFEAAIRRDPANWFWVHNRWKTAGKKRRNVEALKQ